MSIAQPTASKHLALAVPPPGLGYIPVLSRLEGDVGEFTLAYSMLDAGWALPSHLTPLPLSSFALALSFTIWGAFYAPPGTLETLPCMPQPCHTPMHSSTAQLQTPAL